MTVPGRRLLFTATIFAGSFLLFLIQPMIARMALPRLGGAPAVWNSAMLVYQALLLGGYAYAHWLSRRAPRTQAAVHLTAFVLAALLLPIGLSGASLDPGTNAFLWVPWLLLVSIGPLFLLISANAPLRQCWFAFGGGDPYPLYAASNLGSFAGLIFYPLLLEPLLPVSGQRLLWSIGYALLLVLLAGCAAMLWKHKGQGARTPVRRPDSGSVARWAWLAFIPSGLMLATTLFLTTDIMPMPLLWVVPLGLYLLSFTIAFSARGRVAALLSLVAPYLLVPAAISLFIGERLPFVVTALILLAALLAIATACHRRIYETRPDPTQLTGFYLALAAGGALGGLLCAIIAPLVFDWTYEFPLLLFAAALTLLPGYSPLIPAAWFRRRAAAAIVPALAALAQVAAVVALAIWRREDELARYGAFAAMLAGSLAVGSRLLLASVMAAAMLLAGAWDKLELTAQPDRMTRTYFGVYSIIESRASRQLLHGTTLHGIQLRTPGWERYPTSYYGHSSGVGRALRLAPALFGPDARISVVGLGAGTLACYRQQRQRWTFFELDPAIAELATRSGKFTFLRRCAPDARIVLGDARLQLAREAPASADVLIVDAFSSDAVPMHLLTAEAFALYARHLKPDGLLLVHISNRHLDLEPVVAAAPGWHARIGWHNTRWDHRHLTASDWMALSRSPATIAALVRTGGAFWEPPTSERQMWTDDHASLLSVID